MEIVKLQTEVDRLNAFIGIVKADTTKIPLKLHNIKNKLTVNKVKSFFKDILDIDIYMYFKTRKRHIIPIKYLFLNTLLKECKLTALEIHDILMLDDNFKYDRSSIYYAEEKHSDYMVGFDPYSVYYKKLWTEVQIKLGTYLTQ